MLFAEKKPLERVAEVMYQHGAVHVFFKLLANNDNSKNQIYFGGDFDVLRIIPHGELIGEKTSDNKTIFKADMNFSWLPENLIGPPAKAPRTQLIFYPNYPEVRMSGFLSGCENSPSQLMKAPTKDERALREPTPRCLVLGVCPDNRILAFVGAWESAFSSDANDRISRDAVNKIASVFYELKNSQRNSRDELLDRLYAIYLKGATASCRLDSTGQPIPYIAKNAAGYTLESLFGIIPNGSSDPDFMDWELKSHRGGAITLMTPEPDAGSYTNNLSHFLINYGRCSEIRRDFTGNHKIGVTCETTLLTLNMEGFDPVKCEITDPNGGLILRDQGGNIAAGWTFNKIVSHWSKKHAKTAYVTYLKNGAENNISYQFGPKILLCEGAELKPFLSSLYNGKIYYDPGVNQKLVSGKWIPKKRNQFRASWNDIGSLYKKYENIDFSNKI